MDAATEADGSDGPGVGRRRFVKGMLAGAALGAAAAGGLAASGWMTGTLRPSGPETTRYAGAMVLPGSPTQRGLPFVRLRVDATGFLHGRPESLEVHRGCHGGWPGADDSYVGDDALRYGVPDPWLTIRDEAERAATWWYHDRLGERINVAHFQDVPFGEGAMFRWRSEGADPTYGAFYGVLLKLRRDEIRAEGDAAKALDDAMVPGYDLVAFDAACTHFCCTAGWHQDELAQRMGLWDTIFCLCHQARFDPRRIETYSFTMGEG